MLDGQLGLIYRNIIDSAGPGTWDRYIDHDDRTTNVVIYCRDKTADTIKIVVDRINDFIRNKSVFGKRSTDVERKGFDKFIYWVDGFFRAQEVPDSGETFAGRRTKGILQAGRRRCWDSGCY